VDRRNYDKSVEFLKDAVKNAKLDDNEKLGMMKRLNEKF